MGLRFQRSIGFGRFFRLNFSKTGVGLSAGVPGVRLSAHSSGRKMATISLPGTGLSYRKILAGSRRRDRDAPVRPWACLRATILGLRVDRAFASGLVMLVQYGATAGALERFERAARLCSRKASAPALFAGFCASELGLKTKAVEHLTRALEGPRLPDRLCTRYLGTLQIPVRPTPSLTVAVPVDAVAAALLLAALLKQAGMIGRALTALESVADRRDGGGENSLPLVVSLAEAYQLSGRIEDAIRITDGVRNYDDPTCQALVIRARALSAKGACEPALAALKEALCSKRRDPEILKAALYERALVREKSGDMVRARKDFETLYGIDAHYADVEERLAADPLSVVNTGAFDGIAAYGAAEEPYDAAKVGAMLRAARRRAGVSQDKFAWIAGVGVNSIRKIESGGRPSQEILERVLRACNAPPADAGPSQGS